MPRFEVLLPFKRVVLFFL